MHSGGVRPQQSLGLTLPYGTAGLARRSGDASEALRSKNLPSNPTQYQHFRQRELTICLTHSHRLCGQEAARHLRYAVPRRRAPAHARRIASHMLEAYAQQLTFHCDGRRCEQQSVHDTFCQSCPRLYQPMTNFREREHDVLYSPCVRPPMGNASFRYRAFVGSPYLGLASASHLPPDQACYLAVGSARRFLMPYHGRYVAKLETVSRSGVPDSGMGGGLRTIHGRQTTYVTHRANIEIERETATVEDIAI